MNRQPSLSQWWPIAVMVGILAGASVLISAQVSANLNLPWAGAVWVLFISWALWFAMGARFSRLHKYLFSLTGGVLFGWLTLLVYAKVFTPLYGDVASVWALPTTVFFAATSIVLLELTDWFEVGFAYFFGYATYFAFVFGGFAGGVDNFTAGVYCWVLLMAGLGFGIVSSTLKNILFNVERVPLEQRKTIFDKE